MSDIQELIHKTSMDCIDKGQRMERERIIKLLQNKHEGDEFVQGLIELIKGELK